jgi:hypothetical protein
MKRLSDLPADMRNAVVTRAGAERFLRALHREGLDYHFDDGALDCLYGNGIVDEECARFIDSQVDACYAAFEASGADLREDCPIGYMLKLMDESGQLPAGALD